ncbi:ATP-binding cassette domain-containing protein [Actinocrispum sp. NPDC049592]|uniref:ATP-binding cassette domain-containing protein n=1 Tax=Actinocrispum sp. NPDC049592 TaxID=3154835 RepID=UPI0034266573
MLEAVAVTKCFNDVTALRGANFFLERGQVHGIAGSKGAGKSTLIKVLAGLHRPDCGMIFHRGVPAHFECPSDAQAAGITTVYQEDNLVDSMSVAANLYLGREWRTGLGFIDSHRMQNEASRLLMSLGISIDPDRRLRSLDPGLRQMIALARAADVDAPIVMLDEPAAALDSAQFETLLALIAWWRYSGTSVVYASRRADELHQICDTVTVLCEGMTVHTGPTATLSKMQLALAMAKAPPPEE